MYRTFVLKFTHLVLFTVIVFSSTWALAEDELPIDLEVTLIGKVLTYDQNLAARVNAAKVLRLAVLYLPNNPASERRAEALLGAVNTLSRRGLIPDVQIDVFKIPYKSDENVESQLASKSATVLYICPGLENKIDDIVASAKTQKRLTVGAQESYVTKGISFGVFVERNKPKMVVNLQSSIDEGAKFSSALLRLATVIR